MKKLLLAATVATLAMNAAQAAPTLYGKLNVSVDYQDNYKFDDAKTKNSQTSVQSNASRLGVKGEEKLTDNLSAVYLAEWQVNADGEGTDWGMRNRFIGLKYSNLGTLKAGFYDSYFKNVDTKVQNTFKDDNLLDNKNFMYGEDRLRNTVGFESDPNLLPLPVQFSIQAQTREDQNKAGAAGATSAGLNTAGTTADNKNGTGVSTSLAYNDTKLGLSAAVAGNFGVAGKYNGAGNIIGDSNAVRVTTGLDLGKLNLVPGLSVGALWQQAKLSDAPKAALAAPVITDLSSLKEQAWTVNGAYSIANTPIALKAMYGSSKTTYDTTDHKISQWGVGADYNLNKQTRFYGVLGQQKKDWYVNNDKKLVVGTGIEFNF